MPVPALRLGSCPKALPRHIVAIREPGPDPPCPCRSACGRDIPDLDRYRPSRRLRRTAIANTRRIALNISDHDPIPTRKQKHPDSRFSRGSGGGRAGGPGHDPGRLYARQSAGRRIYGVVPDGLAGTALFSRTPAPRRHGTHGGRGSGLPDWRRVAVRSAAYRTGSRRCIGRQSRRSNTGTVPLAPTPILQRVSGTRATRSDDLTNIDDGPPPAQASWCPCISVSGIIQ